jgi:ectoine hydroxylase-related dioxygenase (phytanoyl-CoA dioxygenase family)
MIPERFVPLAASCASMPRLRALLEDGYCVVKGAADGVAIAAMSGALDTRFAATPFSVGHFHGARTKRFHRLLARSPASVELVLHAEILAMVRAVLGLWCDFPELNLTQSVEIHPGAPAQIPHCDQSMWPAVPKGSMEFSINVFWPLTPFTPDNGATRVWPRTHWRPRQHHDQMEEPVICAMQPGDALLVLGSTVHAAGANVARAPRRGAIVSYCLGWLKSYENQSLAYDAEFVRRQPDELAALLGYRWHRPNLGTYDGQCPSILLTDRPRDYLATIDALSPQHEALVADFAARQQLIDPVLPYSEAA